MRRDCICDARIENGGYVLAALYYGVEGWLAIPWIFVSIVLF